MSDDSWQVVYPTVAMFGCKYAQCVSNAAKLMTNEQFILPVSVSAAEDVKQSSYTDDLASLDQNMSKCKEKAKIIEVGMNKGNFTLKPWIFSGEKSKEGLKAPGSSSNLGMLYDSFCDTWQLNPNLNFHDKIQDGGQNSRNP